METPDQRTRLLKAGFSGKEIEKLHIESNNFRIVNYPILYDLKEFDQLEKEAVGEGRTKIGFFKKIAKI